MEKKCLFCGNLFTKKVNESLKDWNYRHKFCSKECKDKSKIGKPNKSNTKFKKGFIPWNKGLKGYRSGELNNKWKGGITPINEKIRKSEEYREWRIAVYRKDYFTCQECGEKGKNLHAHHIKKFYKFPELRFNIDNGITLCEDCHRIKHQNMNFIHKTPVMAT